MINDSEYHKLADAVLDHVETALDGAYGTGEIDLEREASVLTIVLPSGKHYLLSKHAPSKQLWVSSPLSGGLHFSYQAGTWALPDGRLLLPLMQAELATLANLTVQL